MEPQHIPQLMAEVDLLDKNLVELLAHRFRCSRKIGSIKRLMGQAAYDPARVRSQQLNFIKLCVEADLDEGMAETLIVTILKQVIAERSKVRAQ